MICKACLHYKADFRGGLHCSRAGAYRTEPGYGPFPIPKCVHDSGLSDLFVPATESEEVASASILKIKEGKMQKLLRENQELKRRLTLIDSAG